RQRQSVQTASTRIEVAGRPELRLNTSALTYSVQKGIKYHPARVTLRLHRLPFLTANDATLTSKLRQHNTNLIFNYMRHIAVNVLIHDSRVEPTQRLIIRIQSVTQKLS